MQTSLVMTIIGPDQPGVVDSISGLVANHGGNWLESRMTRLGGRFAGVLRLQIEDECKEELVSALEQLGEAGIAVLVQGDTGPELPPAGVAATVEIVGHDRPGIVHQIAHALARRGVNVEELHTESQSAPMSGEALFRAVANLRLPEDCDLNQLRAELERVAADLMVDVMLEEKSGTAIPIA